MKKTALILLFLLLMARPGWALSQDGRTTMGPWARVGYVMNRGLVNVVSFPYEMVGTIAREREIHSRAWPLTWLPRFLNNSAVRVASGFNDFLVQPFVVPHTDDLSPMTEPFDLPEFPWQRE